MKRNDLGRFAPKTKVVQLESNGIIVNAKECTQCQTTKPLNEFYKNIGGVGDCRSICKECVAETGKGKRKEKNRYNKKYYRENAERIKKQTKTYRKANLEKVKHSVKKYREKNRDTIKTMSRRYYEKNREKILEHSKKYGKQYREKNVERIKLRNKKYYQSKHGRNMKRFASQRRRAREKEVVATLTTKQWEEALENFKHKCAYCGRGDEKLALDHFVPVSQGGELTRRNTIPACGRCNSSKHNRSFWDWYPKQDCYSEKRERKILRYLGYKDRQQQISLF